MKRSRIHKYASNQMLHYCKHNTKMKLISGPFSLHTPLKHVILHFWFRASLLYINNWPTRCNTKQYIILQVHSTCFGCQPHPSSGVHKTVTTASGTSHIFLCSYLPPTWPRWRAVAAQKNMISTGGCSYSFVYSWWWVWLTPETCRVNLQNNRLLCVASVGQLFI